MAPDGHTAEQSADVRAGLAGAAAESLVPESAIPESAIPETQRPVSPDALAAEARAAADFLKALGHEGRLLMLYHLCDRDLTVTELEQLIMSRQAAVSQQLARLRHEKLVTTRRDGNQIIYSLADARVRDLVQVIQRVFRRP